MITIRRAIREDIPDIMSFMDKHWKPGNILAKDRNFFEWQFLDGDKVNMFLGVDGESGKIYGILGVIIYNQSDNPDVAGCTWQVIKSSNPILGLELQEYMCGNLNVRYGCGAGLSEKSVRINELLGARITVMDHYYRLADRTDYKIAIVHDKIIPKVDETDYALEQISSVEEMRQVVSDERLASCVLSKDYTYIERRYFNHPVYDYHIWKIVDRGGKSRSVLMTREEVMQDRKICKIVDYYGDPEDFIYITPAIDKLMRERGYEFTDIYSFGIPVDIYERAGFCRCSGNCTNIIPNYFHPFEQKNIDLKMIEYELPGLKLFRGDGDQDRPCFPDQTKTYQTCQEL